MTTQTSITQTYMVPEEDILKKNAPCPCCLRRGYINPDLNVGSLLPDNENIPASFYFCESCYSSILSIPKEALSKELYAELKSHLSVLVEINEYEMLDIATFQEELDDYLAKGGTFDFDEKDSEDLPEK